MNYYPPPWWAYGPPPQQNNRPSMSRRELDRIAKNAVRDAMRLRDKDKNDRRKREDEDKKARAKARAATMTFIEIFALGVICQPLVLAVFEIIKHRMQ